MSLDDFLSQLRGLSKPGRGFKPHKHLVLLAVLRLVNEGAVTSPKVCFDARLRRAFKELLSFYGGSSDRDRPHAPFFHLSSEEFWRLVPCQGQEEALERATTVGSAGELTRLVSHAALDEEVFALFTDKTQNGTIQHELECILREGLASRLDAVGVMPDVRAPQSLFAHEAGVLAEIGRRVEVHSLGLVLTNLEIHDPQSNRYFETDLVVVSTFGIYVVELKHWSGRIEIRANSWIQNGSFFKHDPHKANNFKAKLLKGLYEHQYPQFPWVYFESVVVLTNPDVMADGTSVPSTTSHNPTFAGSEKFLQYLKHQRTEHGAKIKPAQCEAFVEFLRKLQSPAPPRDFVFPGYEIVERLYQHTDRAEVVARRTDIRHRRLSRLRVFFPPTSGSAHEERVFHERATATLNAVAKTGDHPNILKVWPVPNENNYIVEGSDWSEQGTLRDLLAAEGRLSPERALHVTQGILAGLDALHRQCVVHRALSPENILMVGDVPKLMNFDLSFQLEDNRTTVIPDASRLKRTPYIAPEVYRGGTTPEAAADLFSVGVVLYEMLTGERPFACSMDLERTGGALDAAKATRLDHDELPSVVKQIIMALVQADPSKRPSSATQVSERLLSAEGAPRPTFAGNVRLAPGARSGLYEIERFHKEGVQAQIYQGLGPRAKPVAIKLFGGDIPLQQVLDEQRLAGTVHHSSIVRVDSYSRWEDGRFYIAFDWIPGSSLRDEIVSGKRPSADRFRGIATQLLEAVEALHGVSDNEQSSPVLHNDIKPENILLADGDRPLLIDFGSASRPRIGLYEGTEGYVAPDLHRGEDRKYCEDGDLYALGVTLHEWLLGMRPPADLDRAEHTPQAGLPSGLLRWLARAAAAKAEDRFSSAADMLVGLRKAFQLPEPVTQEPSEVPPEEVKEKKADEERRLERLATVPEAHRHPNPFLAYLNSLHCRSVASENALAESQASNPLFGLVHVPHPLTESILDVLTAAEPRHVILTGHAGDGKSTIALDVYKRLKGLPEEAPVEIDWKRREDLEARGVSVSIVKDFSECSDIWLDIIDEMRAGGRRFLLISNTGTLLNAFKSAEARTDGDLIVLESDLLETMESSTPTPWDYGGAAFTVINLSMMDNLGIAEAVFRRMVDEDRWKVCQTLECRSHCPVLRNVQLIQQNLDTILRRVFLAYRRMYEYGTRLTLRQLCAHLAYMLTSGLSHQDIVVMSKKAARPLMSEFMFFNRFFGDNGREEDDPAQQIRAVCQVRQQNFGARSAPTWERRLWLQSRGLSFRLQAQGCTDEFDLLRRHGAQLAADEEITDEQARRQVRRMLFFLHCFDARDDGAFLKSFLNSPMIVHFARWQEEADTELSLSESTELQRRVLHVIQEHFTGVRLPEGAPSDRHVFVTLSRHSRDIRQSAQIVLARIPEDDLVLELLARDNGCGGIRRDLVLRGRQQRLDAELQLGLPFLDYVMMRNKGEVGEDLQTSYVDRLERFKGQLLRRFRSGETDDVMLVRLRTNHTFRRQIFAVRKNRLEVTDG